EALLAWAKLLNTVYGRTRTMWSPLITTPRLMELDKAKEDERHVRKEIEVTEEDPFDWDFDAYEFYKATNALLNVSDELKENDSYKFDLTNVYRELLQSLTHRFIKELSTAYHNQDIEAFQKAANQLFKLFDDLEAVTGTNENFMLGKWLEDAKSWGTNPEEKEYYEWNARTIITIWQPWEDGGLRDYAGKAWNGLFSGYYKPRWQLLVNMLEESLKENKEFDAGTYDKAVRKIDFKWTHSNELYPAQPTGDIIEVAKIMDTEYQKYFTK
ncbi:alpha-N-acetylglucosaminidase C-terminal domain-containing protein, partial [Desulfosarcina sp.]|nr:alpha-N-acetylglucosaminidase C-terminal domain-containing protein [Desulfosarcina sp.]